MRRGSRLRRWSGVFPLAGAMAQGGLNSWFREYEDGCLELPFPPQELRCVLLSEALPVVLEWVLCAGEALLLSLPPPPSFITPKGTCAPAE